METRKVYVLYKSAATFDGDTEIEMLAAFSGKEKAEEVASKLNSIRDSNENVIFSEDCYGVGFLVGEVLLLENEVETEEFLMEYVKDHTVCTNGEFYKVMWPNPTWR